MRASPPLPSPVLWSSGKGEREGGWEGGGVYKRNSVNGQRLNPADDRICVAYSPRVVYVFWGRTDITVVSISILCLRSPQSMFAMTVIILEPAYALKICTDRL